MRILIQDPNGNSFFDGAGWIKDFQRAKTFESVAQAEALCREYQFSSVNIMLKFDNPSHDVSYPVGARAALLVSKPPTQRITSLY